MLPQVRFTNRWEGVRDMVFILAGAIILTILLLLIANISTLTYSQNLIPDILVNPIFISLLLLAVALPQIWLEKRLSQQAKHTPQEIDFISDRRHVKVMMDDITYVESNDSEVWIHTLSGESHRTKTTITQWSSILDNGNFIRIHRAYIVNRLYITESDSTTIRISDHELPISRKYRDGVRQGLLVMTE
jgi:DNA-binding LytR/AlgR family response regulator